MRRRDWPSLVITFTNADGADPELTAELAAACLDDLRPSGIEERDHRWIASFQSSQAREEAAVAIREALGPRGSVEFVDLPDDDWAARSQASVGPVTVGRFVVAPPWREHDARAAGAAHTIIIEPSMGFGTGHHATTRLCLAALQGQPVTGRTVIDVGTGSGVLAMAAAALGAREVIGVDDDADAVESARANAALNAGLPPVGWLLADFRSADLGAADLVVANLTGGMLTAAAPRLASLVAPGGRLIVSGYTESERPAVLPVIAAGFSVLSDSLEDGWGCLVLGTGLPEPI